MKTAQELILESEYWMSDPGETENLMIEFAKMHVEAALKEASNKAETILEHESFYSEGVLVVDKDSIINAYPLEKIK